MRLVLEHRGAIVAEFGFLRLDKPPRAVELKGDIYVLSRPIVDFLPDANREVIGYVYCVEAPLHLRLQDALSIEQRMAIR